MKHLFTYKKWLRRTAATAVSLSIALFPMAHFAPSAAAADTTYETPKEITLYRWTEVQSIKDLDISGDGVTQVLAMLDHQYVDENGKITTNGYYLDLYSMLKDAQSGTSSKYEKQRWCYWKYTDENGNPKTYMTSDMEKSTSFDVAECYAVTDHDFAGTKCTDPQVDTSKTVFYTSRDYPTLLVKSVPIDFASSQAKFNGNSTITIDMKKTADGNTFYDTDSSNEAYTFSIGIGDGKGGDTGWYLNEKKNNLVFAPVGQNDGVSCETQTKTKIFRDEGQRPWCFKFFGKRVGLFINIASAKDAAIGQGKSHHVKYEWGWSDGSLMKFIFYKRTPIRMSALDGNLTVKSNSPFQSQNYLYLRPGKTITVEKDAVMTVKGTFYMDGSIEVKNGGTLILEDGACIQPLGQQNPTTGERPSGSVTLDGGNLLVMSNARLLTGVFGTGLVTAHGATVLNCGTIWQCATTVLAGANIENRDTGLFVTGLTVATDHLAAFAEQPYNKKTGVFDNATQNSGMCVVFDSDTRFQNDGTLTIFSTLNNRGGFRNNGTFNNGTLISPGNMPPTGTNTGSVGM